MIIELLDLVTKGMKISIENDINIFGKYHDMRLKKKVYEVTKNVRKLSNVHFTGSLSKLIDDTYELIGTIKGTMIIPDNITLEDYTYDFTSEIEEKIEETRVNFQKTLDITEDLWQNILVEIPLYAVNDKNKGIKLEGNGWRLISEDDIDLSVNKDNPFKELL